MNITGTTMPIELKEAAFLLERLAADCAPLQAYRELTKNALEADERVLAVDPKVSTQVTWDIEWHALRSQLDAGKPPLYKLSIWDTGDGMTGDEMLQYINHLSSSSGVQALNANFGVGAKITAGVANPEGLIYTSYKNGHVHQIHFWRDPATNVYGIRPFELKNGNFVHWRSLRPDVLPAEIVKAGHGTMVTLLGRTPDENTALPPDGAAGGVRWLVRYLNRRFLRFPDGVTVRVRELKSDPNEWPTAPTTYFREGSSVRVAQGQAHYLATNAEASGVKRLDDGQATARWWLLNDSKKIGDPSYWLSTGHVAALYQDELYELRDGTAGVRQLMHFGVLFGSKRVVIYIEPDPALHLTPNTARSQLLSNGEPLPWDKWAAEFRADLPGPIQKMMEDLLSRSSTENSEQAIQDRLKRIEDLMRFTRYRRNPAGAVKTAGEALGGTPGESDTTGTSTRTTRSGGDGGGLTDLYGAYVDDEDGDPADPIVPKVTFPTIRWVSVAAGTREANDHLEDRAASYVNSTQNVLFINEDFRVYTDLVKHFVQLYEGYPGVEQTVPRTIQEWYAQQLVEAVLGILAIRGSAKWTPNQIEQALSEESLTAAVMPRYHIYNSALRALGTKLGSLKESA